MLKPHIANVIQLTGEGTAKSKREVLQGLHDIPQNSPLVIVATGKYVGEGFDIPAIRSFSPPHIMERVGCPVCRPSAPGERRKSRCPYL